ncbi:hypothetical protein Hdeb2414_s0004g00133181 [Helianthus debilis subsp. tardiflorus]
MLGNSQGLQLRRTGDSHKQRSGMPETREMNGGGFCHRLPLQSQAWLGLQSKVKDLYGMTQLLSLQCYLG